MSNAALGNHDESKSLSALSARSTQPTWMRWAGWSMSGLMILFLLFDGASKLALEHHVVEATTKIGYPLDAIRPLGIICLIWTSCTRCRVHQFWRDPTDRLFWRRDRQQGAHRDLIFSSILFGVRSASSFGAAFIFETKRRSLAHPSAQ